MCVAGSIIFIHICCRCVAGVLQECCRFVVGCCRMVSCGAVTVCHLTHLGLVCYRVGCMQVIEACQTYVSATPKYHCNTQQQTGTYCNTEQLIAIQCNTGNQGLSTQSARFHNISAAYCSTPHTANSIEQHTCQRAKQGEEALLPRERHPATGRRSAWHLVQSMECLWVEQEAVFKAATLHQGRD